MTMKRYDATFLYDLLKSSHDLERINSTLEKLTGIINFFNMRKNIKEFINYIERSEDLNKCKDYGDFQTPLSLTDQICSLLASMDINPDVLIEPTCGSGNFVISALKYFKSLKYIYCTDIQAHYEWALKANILQLSSESSNKRTIEYHRDNIFTHKYSNKFTSFINRNEYNILIMGNPPWVTTSTLSALESSNVPVKANIKRERGIEAITGKGNFDIAESIIIKLMEHFSPYQPQIAMLCKTSVIRNIVKGAKKLSLKISNVQSYNIDAKKEFNVCADAALFLADMGIRDEGTCTSSSFYNPKLVIKKYGWCGDKFCSDLSLYNKYKYFDGKSPFEWRQGIKHDAFDVMVLQNGNGKRTNGSSENVDIEDNPLYPFFKSSELKGALIKSTSREIILTQTSPNQETKSLAITCPKLWKYLLKNKEHFNKRKSSIYKNKPDYAIFGIGKYSFKPYKIAISGMYKVPNFVFIPPINNKPVMLDDTCYFLSFDDYRQAFFTWILLNTDEVTSLLSSIVFLDAKRPYTKDILSRIDLLRISEQVSFDKICDTYTIKMKQPYSSELKSGNYHDYQELLRYSIPQLSLYPNGKSYELIDLQKVKCPI